jgi:RHS repeat-associated protein
MRQLRYSAMFVAKLLILVSVFSSGGAAAQTPNMQTPDMAVGHSPYALYNNPGDIDHVNPINGNIFISVPLLSYPQVGKDLRLQFNIYYNDKQWYIPNFAPNPSNNGTNGGAWSWYDFTQNSNQMDTMGAYVARDQHLDFGQDDVTTSQTIGQQPTSCTYQTITLAFWVRGSDGSKHYYGDNSSQSDSGNGCTQNPYGLVGNIYPASDESGYKPANGSYVSGSTAMYDPAGVKYTSNGVTGETVADPNGNSITSTANGWMDSLGRSLPGSTALPGFSDNSGPGTAEDPVPGLPVAPGGTTCPSGTTQARDWAVPAQGGTTEHYYLCYSAFTFHTAFNVQSYIPSDQISEASSSSQNSRPALLLSAVMLPNGTGYTFTYETQYLSLARLGLPTGGSISYTWQPLFLGQGNAAPLSRALKTRIVDDGNGNVATWTYNWQLNKTTNSSGGITIAPPFWSIVTDPLGNDVEYEFNGTDDSGQGTGALAEDREMHYNGCGPHDTFSPQACHPSAGTLMKTESYVLTQVVSTAADQNTPSANQGTLYRPTTTTTTLPVTGGNRITKSIMTLSPAYGPPCTTYTGFGSVGTPFTFQHTSPCSQYPQRGSLATYGYGSSGAGSLLRTDTTTYQWQVSSSALAANLLNIPSTITRTDASGSWASQTGYGYDPAGNQTSVSRYLSSSSALTSTTQYNSQGMPTLLTDAKGHATSISTYQCSGALPETVVTPYGSTTTMVETTSYVYDCATGSMTSKKDPNNRTTSFSYSDPLNRLTGVTYPDNGSLAINYYDSQGGSLPYVTTSQATGEAAGPINRQTDYDGLGRPIHEILTSDTSGADYVDTTYDLLGRLRTMSNPHRPSSPAPTEDGTTTYVYDALGRKVQEQEPDGQSSQQWCFGGVTVTGASNCHPNEAGNADYWIDHSDETARDWQLTMDSLGRISEALEPNTANVPSLKTDYLYNTNDGLSSVLQHGTSGDSGRARSFIYDALGRLTNVCNPEALASGSSACSASGPWSQSYSYDANGNVHTRLDAKGVTTTYTYDDLDRVTAKNYSDGQTLNAYYYYDVDTCGDPSTDATIGRVTYSWTSPNTTNVGINDPNQVGVHCYTYDPMGRITAYDTATVVPGSSADGYGGEIAPVYDLAGRMSYFFVAGNGAFQTSPIHVFKYAYDGAGRVSTISLVPYSASDPNNSSWNVPTSIPTTIFQAAASNGQPAYSAMGLEHAQFVVNSSSQPMMFYDHAFNNRGWNKSSMYTTGAGAVGGAGSQAYSYQANYFGNGSIANVADSVVGTLGNGSGGNVTMDNLNRLTSVTYTGGAYGGITAAWTYDSFGNQKSQTLTGSSSTPVPSNTTTHYDANSHISFSSRNSAALPYDGNGNLTYDVQYAYAYDAENRICAIKISNTYKIYVYDADGNRIAKGNITPPSGTTSPSVSLCSPLKNSFSITQAYALGLNGEEIENYTPGQMWHNTNVWNGDTLIATYAGSYMDVVMSDWLGTRRAQLRNNIGMSGIEDFLTLPYGDGFTMVGGTNFDSLVQMSGHQYNQEDNLYNFDARYYADWVGRFMSPDSFGGHLEDPQTLNHYSYVGNNPLSRTDPDGHDFYQQCGSSDHSGCTQVNTDPKNSKSTQWVQAGADGKATIITSDSIRSGQNSATLTQNGLQVNGAQGIYFDNPASHTTDADGNDVNHNTLDVAGSGQLQGFSFHVDGNCGGTCMSSGEWSAPGMSSAQARSALNANSFTIPFEDARAGFGGGEHGYSSQFRFGGSFFGCAVSACPNTPHISVRYDPASAYPKYGVPAAGMWHVDAHSGWFAHGQDIQNTH